MYRKVSEIVPEGSSGNVRIEHFEVTEDQSRFSVIRREYVSPGTYTRLFINNILMMSDTDMERATNMDVVENSFGDVLIAGLGIGLIVPPILDKEDVTSVTIIEKSQDVINLVEPYYRHPKLMVVCDDIFTWKPEMKYDTIYFDIWDSICVDNLKEINSLHRKAGRWKRDSDSWVSSWVVKKLRRLRDKEKSREDRFGIGVLGGWMT